MHQLPLPLCMHYGKVLNKISSLKSQRIMGASEIYMAANLSILIVDDEPNIRKTLAIALEAEGQSVVAVSNFKDALAEASRRFFDMALVDLRLGTQSGMELIPALRTPAPG